MYLILAAIAPVIIFLYFIYRNDTHKEPFKLLIKCLLGGLVAVILTLTFNIPITQFKYLFNFPLGNEFFDAFFSAAIPEELSKFIALYLVVRKSRDFDQHYDGIVYAVFVSLGFAAIENIMYVLQGGMNVAAVRAVLTIPGHGFFGVLMGYYFSLAHFHKGSGSWLYWLKAILYPVIFHGIYDFILFVLGYTIDYPIVIIILFISFTYLIIRLWKLGFRKIKILTQVDKENEEIIINDWIA